MEATRLVLIVDDEPDIRELLEVTLARMGVEAISAADTTQALAALDRRRDDIDLCLTDMRLPDGSGIEIVEYIQENHPCIPVAMITAHGNMEAAVGALKAGAFDFVSKPVELQVLRNLVNTALKLSRKVPQQERRSRNDLLGESDAMRQIRSTIAKLARSQAPVYISGESGTGKELAARLIHERGPRADRPFVPVNCGAIPEELIESELFGHRKGSFTGATADKQGLFQAADGGTLFLDEVADLPLPMQVKLLRAIQEKAVRPVGSQHEARVDVRILSATHKDLGELVQEGLFREDLYYRINVIELNLPPLRERPEDIPLLVEHILARMGAQMGLVPPRPDASAFEAMRRYGFAGNVRELENILERAVTLCDGDSITEADLGLPAGDGGGVPSSAGIPLESYLNRVERDAILDALARTDQNKTAAAKLLGISFRALRYRLKKLGMD